jgi:hypothetical protein
MIQKLGPVRGRECEQEVEQCIVPHGHLRKHRAERIFGTVVGHKYATRVVEEMMEVEKIHLASQQLCW